MKAVVRSASYHLFLRPLLKSMKTIPARRLLLRRCPRVQAKVSSAREHTLCFTCLKRMYKWQLVSSTENNFIFQQHSRKTRFLAFCGQGGIPVSAGKLVPPSPSVSAAFGNRFGILIGAEVPPGSSGANQKTELVPIP